MRMPTYRNNGEAFAGGGGGLALQKVPISRRCRVTWTRA